MATEIKRGKRTLVFDRGYQKQAFWFDSNDHLHIELSKKGCSTAEQICPSGCVVELSDFLKAHKA